jgi:hypothetical protein
VSYSTRLAEQMNTHPSLRYAGAAVFMGVVAIRVGFVLATYPPASTRHWLSFVVGALVTLVAVIFTVRRSPATQEIKEHPEWMLVAGVAIGLMIFGIVGGMGWTVAGSINLAGENAIVRNFACGAALGSVALFGLGSHRAARKARQQRRPSPGAVK